MTCATNSCPTWRCSTKERAGNNFPEFSQSRPSCGTKLWRCGTKLWQGLLTLPLGRPKVSNPKPGGRPTVQQTAGSGDPRRTANLKSGSYFRPVPYSSSCSCSFYFYSSMHGHDPSGPPKTSADSGTRQRRGGTPG